MIIKRMTASFGCLEGRTLELHEGLNVVSAPNESGKSTWCAFIRAMLYGVDSSERARSGHLPDKLKYAPWSGAPMAGEMDISHAGRDITLRRSTKAANAPMREFSAVYTGTEERVPGLDGASAGEALTGATREVFRRSAFIGQGESAISGSAELEKRIVSVVSTGEEEGASWSEADAQLREWQRKRKYNRRGAIPALEGEIAADEEKLGAMSATVNDLERRTAELELREREAEERQKALDASRASARLGLSQALMEARARSERAEAAHRVALSEAARAEAEAAGGVFGGMSAAEAAEKAEEERSRAEKLAAEAKKRPGILPLALLAALAAACVILGALVNWYIAAGAAVFAALAAWRGVEYGKSRRASERAAAELQRLLGKYGAASAADIAALAAAHGERCRAAESARRREALTSQELTAAREAALRAQEEYVAPSDTPADALKARELSALNARIALLRTSVSELTGAAAAGGDHMALRSELMEKRERVQRLEGQYEAISLAVEALKAADAELQLRFSPALGRRAAQYLARITGGRYDAVAVSRDFSVTARLTGDAQQRDSLYLSAGAADALYLALRLAIVDLTLPAEEPCPIVLDDALAYVDGERRARVMELLREIAEKRQVILFTCSDTLTEEEKVK